MEFVSCQSLFQSISVRFHILFLYNANICFVIKINLKCYSGEGERLIQAHYKTVASWNG